MKIGFIGVGKLGLPVCIGMDSKGHDVLGYDVNPNINSSKTAKDILNSKETTPDGKTDLLESDMLKNSKVKFADNLTQVINHGDIIFCAVQTPHEELFEGHKKMPEERKDFNYEYLVNSIKDISKICDEENKEIILVIISTVLPGTIRKYILPVLSKNIKLCYNPYFIAMGTVLPDFFYPEIILLGVLNEEAKNKVVDFYKTITDSPVYPTTLENAEMIKVTYNTFITAKICLANLVMLMCDNLPNTNCDDVMNALFLANKRIISKNYLTGGMGDGGGCHPRDNIALSWLSNELDLKFNFYDFIMRCREYQTEYIAEVLKKKLNENNLPVVILGKSFKPETGMTTGSPAILLKNMLEEEGIKVERHYDPYIDQEEINLEKKIYVLATRHKIFKEYNFEKGSVVIDPFRMLTNVDQIDYYPIGNSYRSS